MSRGANDGLLMVFTDINILVTVAALLIATEAYHFMVSGVGLSLMCIFSIVIAVVMCNEHYIDGATALFLSLITGMFQGLFVLATVEVMMPIDIWWFYYPVAYLAIWIFEGAYLMCEWGKSDGCKE